MFDHVTIRVTDASASRRFYDVVLGTLGYERAHDEWGDFSLVQADPAELASPVTRRLHVGFTAPSYEHVDAFWRAGIAAGYRDDGPPGPRPQYRDDYYGGFLLDPDGNSMEAVHHGAMHPGSMIDHLWIRVADVDAGQRFYDLVGPHAGFALHSRTPEHAFFRSATGSFSLVAGEPTVGLHVAFGVDGDEHVDAFHEALTAAGYASNGAPGERPVYHPGYYGAFVWDPDGANVELVDHHR